jgi:hypothetical protein
MAVAVEIVVYNLLLFLCMGFFVVIFILVLMYKHKVRFGKAVEFTRMLFTEILLFNERWSINELEKWGEETQRDLSFKDIIQSCGISFLFPNRFSSFWGDMRSIELEGVEVISENFNFIVTKLSFFKGRLSLDCTLESKLNDKVLKLKRDGYMNIDDQQVKVTIKPDEDASNLYTVSVNKNLLGFFDVIYGTEISLKCKILRGSDIELPTFLVPTPKMPRQVAEVFSKSNYLLFCAVGGFNFIALIVISLLSLLLLLTWKVIPFVFITSLIALVFSVKLNLKLFGIVYSSLKS